jgi:hypothetical protein
MLILQKVFPGHSDSVYSSIIQKAASTNSHRVFHRATGAARSPLEEDILNTLNELDMLPRTPGLNECRNRLPRFDVRCNPTTVLRNIEIHHNAGSSGSEASWTLTYTEAIRLAVQGSQTQKENSCSIEHDMGTVIAIRQEPSENPTVEANVSMNVKDADHYVVAMQRALVGEGFHRRLRTSIVLPYKLTSERSYLYLNTFLNMKTLNPRFFFSLFSFFFSFFFCE